MSSDKTFLAILRSVLWDTDVELPSDVDWQCVLNLAARQKCLHAFSVWLKSHRIYTPFNAELHSAIFVVLQRQVRLNYLTSDVIRLLANNKIPATLIKGYSLSRMYPDVDTRDFGDVDIYVGETNYLRATEILTSAYPDAHWHSETYGGIHYILVLDDHLDRVVELHRVTMELRDRKSNALYQKFTHKYLELSPHTIDIYGTTVAVPSAAYNVLYVFMHAWHHFASTGVGFRQLGDWALSLKHAYSQMSSIQWNNLVGEIDEILTASCLKIVWQTFGHLLVDELNLPVECFPLYTSHYQRRAKRLMLQILRDGHGGRPATIVQQDIRLMKSYPFHRPQKGRIFQLGYTCCRLLFEAWQLSKFFPQLALFELVNRIRFPKKRCKNG